MRNLQTTVLRVTPHSNFTKIGLRHQISESGDLGVGEWTIAVTPPQRCRARLPHTGTRARNKRGQQSCFRWLRCTLMMVLPNEFSVKISNESTDFLRENPQDERSVFVAGVAIIGLPTLVRLSRQPQANMVRRMFVPTGPSRYSACAISTCLLATARSLCRAILVVVTTMYVSL